MSPLKFFKRAEPAILTAFSTSSSATLPTTLKVAEERLGVPRPVARFVCTLGATANMNGTALFEGVTVLFLAQFFGVELSLGQQVTHPGAVHARRDRRGRRAGRLAAGDRDDPRDVRHPARRHRPDPRRRPLPRHVPDHGQRHRRPGRFRGGGARFGRWGRRLAELALGIDHSRVEPERPAQSISSEDTLAHDLPLAELRPVVERLAPRVHAAAAKTGRIARTVVLKLKTAEFRILTRSLTAPNPPGSAAELAALAWSLSERVDLPATTRYRLVGVGLGGFVDAQFGGQADLFVGVPAGSSPS
jgi:hypothetical protein